MTEKKKLLLELCWHMHQPPPYLLLSFTQGRAIWPRVEQCALDRRISFDGE